ncbi:MAG: hypothetical protein NZ958_03920 [Bacteroidia bacterium]|nr:hypothetical protein [Bacteroidia bacterium]
MPLKGLLMCVSLLVVSCSGARRGRRVRRPIDIPCPCHSLKPQFLRQDPLGVGNWNQKKIVLLDYA